MMNVCKASGIVFLSFVSLCSLHGMESNSDSGSESEEEITYTEDQKEYIAFCSAILYGKARVDAGNCVTFSHPETYERYQIVIDTACSYVKESASQAEDNKLSVITRFVPQGLVHFFTDGKFDLPVDISELDRLLNQQKEGYEELERINFIYEYPLFANVTALLSTNFSKLQKEKLQRKKALELASKKWNDEAKPVYEYFDSCNNREQKYSEMRKKLQSNRAQVLDALKNKDIEGFSAVCQKPVQLVHLVQDSEKESGAESKIGDIANN